MRYVAHTKIQMKSDPGLSEKWVQGLLADNPALLGLGDLDVKDVERRQPHAGRLDMLLSDPETATRYEVELQLGATDESHIIRTIEYWDTERRRYPQYEHVAVIIAEEITSRFFNVISLFNGFIPIVAIQMTALRVSADEVTLVFTKVLDHTTLATDEEDEGEPTDRKYWETKASRGSLALADQVHELVRAVDPAVELKYNKFYIGLSVNGVATTYVSMRPRKKQVNVSFRIPRSDNVTALVEESGIETLPYEGRWGNYRVIVKDADLVEHRDLLEQLIEIAHQNYTT
jgi:predicted transport protein